MRVMPELPEVETVARGVHARIRDDRIQEVWVSARSEPFRTPAPEMVEQLPGLRIDRVYRVGKHIVFDLYGSYAPATSQSGTGYPDAQWIVHLGMTGRLLVSDPAVAIPPHTHAVLRLSSGRELRFVDARRFGRLALRPNPRAFFEGPGTEPLGITAQAFRELFRTRRTPIKSALLNQKLLHGVGNIYADESLFRAGIRPRRISSRLSRSELERLRTSLQQVLHDAIQLGGSSVSDYVDTDGVRGFFQLEHRVYGRAGEPCRVCGAPIRRIVIAGRGTHYCPHCQK
jgi:formamidopyrimidine-DNA glycosylase